MFIGHHFDSRFDDSHQIVPYMFELIQPIPKMDRTCHASLICPHDGDGMLGAVDNTAPYATAIFHDHALAHCGDRFFVVNSYFNARRIFVLAKQFCFFAHSLC